MNNSLYLGLVHYPVYNRKNEIVTTSITNLDLHDIARSCKTYGVKTFFCINPLESQNILMSRIKDFWQTDAALKFNSDRVEAFKILQYSKAIEDAKKMIMNQEGYDPIVVTTTAMVVDNQIAVNDLVEIQENINRPILLLFGTGGGLVNDIHNSADYTLLPLNGVDNYNHLTVRSAVAIYLDRFSSEKYRRNYGYSSSVRKGKS